MKEIMGLFITFGPRDGVENETLNEQNTLRCLLAQTRSDLSCLCKRLHPVLPVLSACCSAPDLVFIRRFGPRMEPAGCVDSAKLLRTDKAPFICTLSSTQCKNNYNLYLSAVRMCDCDLNVEAAAGLLLMAPSKPAAQKSVSLLVRMTLNVDLFHFSSLFNPKL